MSYLCYLCMHAANVQEIMSIILFIVDIFRILGHPTSSEQLWKAKGAGWK